MELTSMEVCFTDYTDSVSVLLSFKCGKTEISYPTIPIKGCLVLASTRFLYGFDA